MTSCPVSGFRIGNSSRTPHPEQSKPAKTIPLEKRRSIYLIRVLENSPHE